MGKYIWQLPQWPNISCTPLDMLPDLAGAREAYGYCRRCVEELDQAERAALLNRVMTAECESASALDGVSPDRTVLRSLVRSLVTAQNGSHPGMQPGGDPGALLVQTDPQTSVLVSAYGDVLQHRGLPEKTLLALRACVDLTEKTGQTDQAHWRSGPMYFLRSRKEIVYEAPPAEQVGQEMQRFLAWSGKSRGMETLFRAALAHLYYMTVLPGEKGNGRMASLVSYAALLPLDPGSMLILSMAEQILHRQDTYYDVLIRTLSGSGNCTEWFRWYIACFHAAVQQTTACLADLSVSRKFWKLHAGRKFSERQTTVLNVLLAEIVNGGEGLVSTARYADIAHTSRITAWRDLSKLLAEGLIRKHSGAEKNLVYSLVLEKGGVPDLSDRTSGKASEKPSGTASEKTTGNMTEQTSAASRAPVAPSGASAGEAASSDTSLSGAGSVPGPEEEEGAGDGEGEAAHPGVPVDGRSTLC